MEFVVLQNSMGLKCVKNKHGKSCDHNPTTQTAHCLISLFTTKLCVPGEHVKNSASVKVLLTDELKWANVKPLVLLDLYGFPVSDKVCLAVAR